MTGTPWPVLDYQAIRPTVAHLHRLSQIGGRYSMPRSSSNRRSSTRLAASCAAATSPIGRPARPSPSSTSCASSATRTLGCVLASGICATTSRRMTPCTWPWPKRCPNLYC